MPLLEDAETRLLCLPGHAWHANADNFHCATLSASPQFQMALLLSSANVYITPQEYCIVQSCHGEGTSAEWLQTCLC